MIAWTEWLALGIGIVLTLLAIADLIWTTLWVGGGAGPVTRRVGDLAWRAIKGVGSRHRLLTAAGPLIVSLTVAVWVAMLWLGWFLIFLCDDSAVVSSSTRAAAGAFDRLYFAGYTVFTLGNGEFQPNGDGWQLATALAAGSGLFAITLAITYLLSIISAAVGGRAFAAQVSGLGADAAETIAGGWDGKSFCQLGLQLQSLSGQLAQLGEQFLAYPVLQYFHAGSSTKSPIVALVKLEQIVAVLNHAFEDEPPLTLMAKSARSSIDNVLDALPEQFMRSSAGPLAVPDLEPLRHAGFPVVSGELFEARLAADDERRKTLRGLLNAHGWAQEDVQ